MRNASLSNTLYQNNFPFMMKIVLYQRTELNTNMIKIKLNFVIYIRI